MEVAAKLGLSQAPFGQARRLLLFDVLQPRTSFAGLAAALPRASLRALTGAQSPRQTDFEEWIEPSSLGPPNHHALLTSRFQ